MAEGKVVLDHLFSAGRFAAESALILDVRLPGMADTLAKAAPDMPLYTFHLKGGTDADVIRVTDPGRALISGRYRDIGKFKGPILRALAARAPYFHNGFAASLDEVVGFYDGRFGIGLTAQEKSDLVAFLKTL